MQVQDLMDCYCKAREVINFYCRYLEDSELTDDEKETLLDFITSTVTFSNKIRRALE
ncbi:hypothetical protein HNQ35_002737 [Cerasibacillus quisquiliarum]|uniref:Uncharacterized protein n=1 Tax=Cerasibacillus quisquiliarum TaxID=227865 RepID=A0A511V364_9BACI|nr:hypothetical protein [Cerasibacillus quisquiliarum]MBB5147508.1 hypothetical protein [Cerasibacillus quisquiliarum]GEN32358.1 hypothetical protein CQU01_25960 [Cerasibacillus quisquiliarum]